MRTKPKDLHKGKFGEKKILLNSYETYQEKKMVVRNENELVNAMRTCE